jgi:hypothetical protein
VFCFTHIRQLVGIRKLCPLCDEEGFVIDEKGERKRCEHRHPNIKKYFWDAVRKCSLCRELERERR